MPARRCGSRTARRSLRMRCWSQPAARATSRSVASSAPAGARRRRLCGGADSTRNGPDSRSDHRRQGFRRAALAGGAGAHTGARARAPRPARAPVPDALGVPAPHHRRPRPHATDAAHRAYTQVVADTHPLDSPGRRLAVVIPTLNDDAALARLLPILAHLELPPEPVIVVDRPPSEAPAAP